MGLSTKAVDLNNAVRGQQWRSRRVRPPDTRYGSIDQPTTSGGQLSRPTDPSESAASAPYGIPTGKTLTLARLHETRHWTYADAEPLLIPPSTALSRPQPPGSSVLRHRAEGANMQGLGDRKAIAQLRLLNAPIDAARHARCYESKQTFHAAVLRVRFPQVPRELGVLGGFRVEHPWRREVVEATLRWCCCVLMELAKPVFIRASETRRMLRD
ncbi:hypothetical protein F5B20DRAFT_575814 [Whalleya microplaca]|nr:hypothetical protein F5B20DRAFT_575814 [Whalleya microplaca]